MPAAEPLNDHIEQVHRDKKECGPNQVISVFRPVLQPGQTQRDQVEQHQYAQPNKVEDVAQQDRAQNHQHMRAPPEAVKVPGHHGDKAHRHRAPDAVAPGRDKHAELRRKHQPQFVWAQRLAQRHRKGPRHMRRGALQRKVHKHVEHMRDRVDEKQQRHRKKGGAQQPRTTKQQHQPCAVSARNHGVRREKNRPLRRQDQRHHGLLTQSNQRRRHDQQDQSPPGSAQLPVQRPPRPQNQQQAYDRNHHPDRLQRVRHPQQIQELRRRPDRRQTKNRQTYGNPCGKAA